MGISHGLVGIDRFNDKGFADDPTLFAQSIGAIQVLFNEVQKIEAWNGLKVNRDKTRMLTIGERTRRHKL